MARGTTLGVLIDDVRAEAGHSLQSNLGTAMRDVLIKILQRQQKRLWEDFDWPFLRVTRLQVMQAGERYYDFPVDLNIERLERVDFRCGGRWCPVGYGIENVQLDIYDSDSGVRGWPVERWNEAENNQVEMWPVPSQNGALSPLDGVVRYTGIRKLRPLVQEVDRADLDDTLLVLFSAAEILAREKANDAGLKLQLAQTHYNRLKGRNAKRESFSLIGGREVRMPHDPNFVVVRNP